MQMTEDLIRSVVQQVLSQMGERGRTDERGTPARPSGTFGVYPTADAAVAAAEAAFAGLPRPAARRPQEGRRAASADLRRAGRGARPRWSWTRRRSAGSTTRSRSSEIARRRSPASSSSGPTNVSRRQRPDADRVRPVRRHRRDHAGHAQPADAGRQRDQHARGRQHGGRQPAPVGGEDRRRGRPPLQPGDPPGDRHRQPDHDHRPADAGVGRGALRPPRRPLLVVTGGPAVARAALAQQGRAIVAGPGNPPVVVDETACLDNAAKSIVKGGAYDNNLLCIGEKQVFAVAEHLRQADGRGRPPRRLPPERRSRSTR